MWSDCGAEQGDPHGSVQCALTLAGVASRTRAGIIEARARAGPTAGAPVASGGSDSAAPEVPGLRPVPGYFDAWFADDGQLVCRPHDLDAVLRRMDAEAHKVGATRGAGPDVKSEVKIVAHPTAFAALRDDWVTEYIRETCVLKPANAGSEVLGVCIGSDAMRQTQVTAAMMKIQALHASLVDLEDPAVELVLGRQCADVAKLSHLLRAAGPWIPQSSLQVHDSMQQAYVERVLAADLDAHSKMQMSIGVSDGGWASGGPPTWPCPRFWPAAWSRAPSPSGCSLQCGRAASSSTAWPIATMRSPPRPELLSSPVWPSHGGGTQSACVRRQLRTPRRRLRPWRRQTDLPPLAPPSPALASPLASST